LLLVVNTRVLVPNRARLVLDNLFYTFVRERDAVSEDKDQLELEAGV
jgi:hypothetical protein